MHYYQFNIGDYIKHTVHLSNEEDLAYRRLLDMYYDTESPIPTDIPLVSRRLRVGIETVQTVLSEFFELTKDGWRNRRADAEIEEYYTFIEKQRSNGKLGGRPKKTHRLPTANPSLTQTEPKKSLTTPINQEPINTPPTPPCRGGDACGESVDPNRVSEPTDQKPRPKPESRGTRLSSDLEFPEDWKSFCESERPDLLAGKLFLEFRDYWLAVPGAKGKKLDWFATWRNRVRNARSFEHGKNNQNNRSPPADNSAYGRVKAAVERERAAESIQQRETEINPGFVDRDGCDVRSPMVVKLRN